MPNLDRVREEIVEAALDVLGPYGRSKAERIADRAVAGFKAHGWAVFTEQEMDQVEDLPRIPLDDDTERFRRCRDAGGLGAPLGSQRWGRKGHRHA